MNLAVILSAYNSSVHTVSVVLKISALLIPPNIMTDFFFFLTFFFFQTCSRLLHISQTQPFLYNFQTRYNTMRNTHTIQPLGRKTRQNIYKKKPRQTYKTHKYIVRVDIAVVGRQCKVNSLDLYSKGKASRSSLVSSVSIRLAYLSFLLLR